MKIVNRNEFLALPNGVLFRKFEPCVFQDIQIKKNSYDNDFVCVSLDWVKVDNPEQNDYNTLQNAMNNGESFEFDYEMTYRDGLYDDEWFAIYEKDDIQELSEVLQYLLNNYPVTIK